MSLILGPVIDIGKATHLFVPHHITKFVWTSKLGLQGNTTPSI